MESEKTARKPTTAERLAARALGVEQPESIEVETRSAGARHLERIKATAHPVKPEALTAAEWFASRIAPEDDEPDTA